MNPDFLVDQLGDGRTGGFFYAYTTVSAFAIVNPYPARCDQLKQPGNGAYGADSVTKRPVDHQAGNNEDRKHYDE